MKLSLYSVFLASTVDAASEKEYIDFFERAKKFTGGPRNYDQMLEAIRLCEAEKAAQAAGIAVYFARQWNRGKRDHERS